LPPSTFFANPTNKKQPKGINKNRKNRNSTVYIKTVKNARSKATLPSPPNPLLTKEAAPVEGLTGAVELTNSVPQVTSIIAAAVV
jgi:hypothetical protein